jgi:hypothetical protein
MSINNILQTILQGDTNTTIEKAKLIEITKKTVRFGDDVYQFCNVAGFGVSEIKRSIPVKLVVALLTIWFALLSVPTFRIYVLIIGILAIIFILKVRGPKTYGLKLYINSGDSKIFATKDIEGIKTVVLTLYEFMESNEEGSYVINIDQSRAIIGVGYAENFRTK